MKTTTKTIQELIEAEEPPPLPLSAIPNGIGINLCAVEAMTWTVQDDGQLVSLTIHFAPDHGGAGGTRPTANRLKRAV
jgi:hypothetical protein